jgi:hypothetical protein
MVAIVLTCLGNDERAAGLPYGRVVLGPRVKRRNVDPSGGSGIDQVTESLPRLQNSLFADPSFDLRMEKV